MRNVTQGIAVRRFRETDIFDIQGRQQDILTPRQAESIAIAGSGGVTYTILVNEEPAAIVGCHILWEGAAQIWSISSDLIRGYGLTYYKICDELLQQVAVKYNIRRYHGIVHQGLSENIRWAISLGFEYEFTMREAAPDGVNVIGYVRWEEKNGRRRRNTSTRLQEYVGELLAMAS